MRYTIIESATGDDLGTLEIPDDAGDLMIIEALCETGYLHYAPESYEITEDVPILSDFDTEGALVVRDEEGPVLVLEPETDECGDDTEPSS